MPWPRLVDVFEHAVSPAQTWVHEGGVSTPFVVHWPNGIAAHGELVTGDPFTYERGTDAPRYPGKSLVPALKQDVTVARDSIWFLHEGNRALRARDWKIVAAGQNAPWELYDLSNDRSESKNLAAEKPDKVRELPTQREHEATDYKKWTEKDAPADSAGKATKKQAITSRQTAAPEQQSDAPSGRAP